MGFLKAAYETYEETMRRALSKHLGNRARAGRAELIQDCISEALFRLWMMVVKKRTWRDGSLKSWLVVTARNALIDELRKKANHPEYPLPEGAELDHAVERRAA